MVSGLSGGGFSPMAMRGRGALGAPGPLGAAWPSGAATPEAADAASQPSLDTKGARAKCHAREGAGHSLLGWRHRYSRGRMAASRPRHAGWFSFSSDRPALHASARENPLPVTVSAGVKREYDCRDRLGAGMGPARRCQHRREPNSPFDQKPTATAWACRRGSPIRCSSESCL